MKGGERNVGMEKESDRGENQKEGRGGRVKVRLKEGERRYNGKTRPGGE